MTTDFQPPYVLLANGPFPAHQTPLDSLKSAGTIICTDGSGDKLLQWGRSPTVLIGDNDSTALQPQDISGHHVSNPDQNTTDLEKALNWCIEHNLSPLTILGATGDREDHTLTNLLLLNKYRQALDLRMITDHATITCHEGSRTFRSWQGQTVSLLPLQPIRRLSTKGLQYSLNDEPLIPSGRGMSNVALDKTFTVYSSQPIWVFRSHRE
jgi:thiamine pyrophosphokinase